MRRREMLLMATVMIAAPRCLRAQQRAMPVVGYLGSGPAEPGRVAAFRRGLSETGYIEGQSVAVVPTALAAKRATTTIPIVFTLGVDPVELGLVASLSRPGGNITGVVLLAELAPKRLDLLHELLPATTVIGLLVNPTNPANAEVQERSLR